MTCGPGLKLLAEGGCEMVRTTNQHGDSDLGFPRNNTLSVLHVKLLEYFIDSGYICCLRRSVIEVCPNIS
jgi:hypothetical protein